MPIWDEWLEQLCLTDTFIGASFGVGHKHLYCPFRNTKRLRRHHVRYLTRARGSEHETEVFRTFLKNSLSMLKAAPALAFSKDGGWVIRELLPALCQYATLESREKFRRDLRTCPRILRWYSVYLLKASTQFPPPHLVLSAMMDRLKFLLSHYHEECSKLPISEQELFHECVIQTIGDVVMTALKQCRCRHTLGLCFLRRGLHFYTACVNWHCGIALHHDDVYNYGMSEVKRLRREIDALPLLDKVVTVSGVEAVELYRKIVERVHESNIMCNLMAKTQCAVKEMPAADQLNGPLAYYSDGVFYVNTSLPHPVYQAEALAFHEAVPGHHLQYCYETRTERPFYRHLASHTAYAEGWAMLAEHMVAPVLPHGDRGVLESEILRAVRLVVDVGIHAKRWTYTQSFDYMKENAFISEAEIRQEIIRYTCEPAQALGYYIGLKILRDLSKECADDVCRLYHTLLSEGPMPSKSLISIRRRL